jgi:hypothetical protein
VAREPQDCPLNAQIGFTMRHCVCQPHRLSLKSTMLPLCELQELSLKMKDWLQQQLLQPPNCSVLGHQPGGSASRQADGTQAGMHRAGPQPQAAPSAAATASASTGGVMNDQQAGRVEANVYVQGMRKQRQGFLLKGV